jgi:hypothetical protein
LPLLEVHVVRLAREEEYVIHDRRALQTCPASALMPNRSI